MSGVLVDSNVILDILTESPEWAEWSQEALEQAFEQHTLVINPLIYAEILTGFEKEQDVHEAIDLTDYQWRPIPWAAAFPASQAFWRYRQRGGVKTAPLPDFYIGAHAQVEGLRVLTRDPRPYRSYFPEVGLIHPK